MSNIIFSPAIVYTVNDTLLMENGDLAFCLEDRKIYFKINNNLQYYGGGDLDIDQITDIVRNLLEEYKEDILLILEQKFKEFLEDTEFITYIEQKIQEFITAIRNEFNQKFESLSPKWEVIDRITVYVGDNANISIAFNAPQEFDFTSVIPETVKVPFYTDIGKTTQVGIYDRINKEFTLQEEDTGQSTAITSRTNRPLDKNDLTITVKHMYNNNEELSELEYTVDNYSNDMYAPDSEHTNKPSNIIIPASKLNRYGGKVVVTIEAKVNIYSQQGENPAVIFERTATETVTINVKKN